MCGRVELGLRVAGEPGRRIGEVEPGNVLETMAQEARSSRSAFSDRFTSVVGQPAMTYVLSWRMAVARDALAADRVRVISEVSRWLGHKSITTTVDLYGHLVPEGCAKDGRLRPRGAGQEEEKG